VERCRQHGHTAERRRAFQDARPHHSKRTPRGEKGSGGARTVVQTHHNSWVPSDESPFPLSAKCSQSMPYPTFIENGTDPTSFTLVGNCVDSRGLTQCRATVCYTLPNDQAHLPAGRESLHVTKSRHAPPVRCSAWLGDLSHCGASTTDRTVATTRSSGTVVSISCVALWRNSGSTQVK
jgi:hypothetical protein